MNKKFRKDLAMTKKVNKNCKKIIECCLCYKSHVDCDAKIGDH